MAIISVQDLDKLRKHAPPPYLRGSFDRIASLEENVGTAVELTVYGPGNTKHTPDVADWCRCRYHPNVNVNINPDTHKLYGSINNFIRIRRFPQHLANPTCDVDVVYQCASAMTRYILEHSNAFAEINTLANKFMRGRYSGDSRDLRDDINTTIDQALIKHYKSLTRAGEKLYEYIQYVINTTRI